MADFRKITVLAALVLLLGLAGTASAQVAAGAFTCVANAAVPPTLRAEGFTELTGDIVIDCVGGVPTLPTQLIPRVNFTIYYSVPITSRTDSGTSGASEAIMLIDEPSFGAPGAPNQSPLLACGSITGCDVTGTAISSNPGVVVAGPEPFSGAAGRPNVFRSTVSNNVLQFIGVPVDAPGTSGHRIFRITNVRGNVTAVQPNGNIPGQVNAYISASGSTSVPITSPNQVVGYVTPGISFKVRQPGSATTDLAGADYAFAQCNSLSRKTPAFIAQFTELFPTAFKLKSKPGTANGQNFPGNIYNTESGFYQTTGILSTAGGTLPVNPGLADSATRLKLVITNVPVGVNVYASTALTTATTSAVLLTGEVGGVAAAATKTDANCPSALCTGVTSETQISVTGQTAVAVWEVTGTNDLSSDSYNFGVWFEYTGLAASNSPLPGVATASGGFAPTPSGLGATPTAAGTASSSLNIPRFIDATGGKSVLQIYICRTNLLFPFVTNQGGFDTGIAISNTSTDPWGTTPQTGTCTLNFYGDAAPAAWTTPSAVPSGKTWVTTASLTFPGFQGYIIAQCGFQFAHGFAFVSDFGSQKLAMGYLALIIPDTGLVVGARTPVGQGSAAGGEGLIQ